MNQETRKPGTKVDHGGTHLAWGWATAWRSSPEEGELATGSIDLFLRWVSDLEGWKSGARIAVRSKLLTANSPNRRFCFGRKTFGSSLQGVREEIKPHVVRAAGKAANMVMPDNPGIPLLNLRKQALHGIGNEDHVLPRIFGRGAHCFVFRNPVATPHKSPDFGASGAVVYMRARNRTPNARMLATSKTKNATSSLA